jgi:pyruvate dehydrogenase E2 component (dihydrolipoamide acetyltransferase)
VAEKGGIVVDEPATTAANQLFALPSLGADMDQGTVLEWFVSPGDEVKRGDVVARVETEKSDIDVEIWQAGTVTEVLVDTGVQVPVGTPLLRLGERVGSSAAPAESGGVTDLPDFRRVPSPPTSNPPETASTTEAMARRGKTEGGPLSSPFARTLSKQRGVDITALAGTGPAGAIIARDIPDRPDETSKPQRADAPSPAERMRHVIAERMSIANRDIPHYYLDFDVDMTEALTWMASHNEHLDVAQRIVPAALLIKATAKAAAAVPKLNGFWSDGVFQPAAEVNVAVAISLRQGGLVTPVIGAADQLSVDQTMDALRERVAGARSGSLRSSWMDGGTITVTNVGDHGADRVHGVIFPPQVALVGFGRIRERPMVYNGLVAPRSVVVASLSADHRATDGATGSRLLTRLNAYLQKPEEL